MSSASCWSQASARLACRAHDVLEQTMRQLIAVGLCDHDALYICPLLQRIGDRMFVNMNRGHHWQWLDEQVMHSCNKGCRRKLHPAQFIDDHYAATFMCFTQGWQRHPLKGGHVNAKAADAHLGLEVLVSQNSFRPSQVLYDEANSSPVLSPFLRQEATDPYVLLSQEGYQAADDSRLADLRRSLDQEPERQRGRVSVGVIVGHDGPG